MRRVHRGFTLIEILVVVVIIGIITAIAMLSIGVLGHDSQLEDQARRLDAVLGEICEEAELQGKDIGLLVERDGYQFMRYDYLKHAWLEIPDDELTARRTLPDGMRIRLWLEGREVVVKTHVENQALLASSSSSSASSVETAGPLTSNSTDSTVTPQIAVLSTGDISPFELRFQKEGDDFYWKITGAADNTLTLAASDTT